jgi:topoisomerase-4 subunit A
MSVSEILHAGTEQLLELLLRELELRRGELDDLFHSKTLEQIFIEERIYKRIEEQTSYEAVQQAVLDGFAPFLKRLRRAVTLDDVESLLQIKIRRISRYDIERNRQEIEGILREESEVTENIKGLRAYAVRYLKNLIKKYRPVYPRLTRLADAPFGQIEVRALTASELSLKIDRENGYIGTDIRSGEELFKCSSLDKIIVVWNDGRYKMMPPPDKFFVDKKGATYCQIFDRDKTFTCVYTEPHYGFTYIKRFAFGGAIQNKEYRLAPEGSKLILFEEDVPDAVFVKYKPAKSQRIHQQMFTPAEVLVKGVAAKGIQMTSKDIARIATKKPGWWDDNETTPKGVLT